MRLDLSLCLKPGRIQSECEPVRQKGGAGPGFRPPGPVFIARLFHRKKAQSPAHLEELMPLALLVHRIHKQIIGQDVAIGAGDVHKNTLKRLESNAGVYSDCTDPDRVVARLYTVRGQCAGRLSVRWLTQRCAAFQRSGFLTDAPLSGEVCARGDHWSGLLLARLYFFVLRKSSGLISTLVLFPVVLPTYETGPVLFLWNNLSFSLTFISSDSLRTLQAGLLNFTGEYGQIQWGPTFAAICLVVFPTLIVYLILNQREMKRLTAGSLKG